MRFYLGDFRLVATPRLFVCELSRKRAIKRVRGEADLPKKRNPRKSKYLPKSPEQVRAIAQELRRQLGIQHQHAPDISLLFYRMRALYPKFKLKEVKDSDLPDMEAKAYSGAFMLKVREGIMNALRTYGDARSRFTVAHELGHLLLGHPGNQARGRPGKKVSTAQMVLENEANLFASEFLIPTNLLDRSFTTGRISQSFQVSLDVADRRRRELEKGPATEPTEVCSKLPSRTTVEKSFAQPTVFISMAFSPEMNRLYCEILKPAIESLGLSCLRADEISSVAPIATDIERAINNCDAVIAEISGFNPNVMHEIGLAQSKKPTIIICRNGYTDDKIPSNIRHIRRIIYSNDVAGGPELYRQLEQTLLQIFPHRDMCT
jgi:Zn-dependent peptidase ImmA (M78 family)